MVCITHYNKVLSCANMLEDEVTIIVIRLIMIRQWHNCNQADWQDTGQSCNGGGIMVWDGELAVMKRLLTVYTAAWLLSKAFLSGT